MSPLQMIALVAGVLYGLLALTLWLLLRRRHPALDLERARRIEQPAFDQILGRLQTVRHDNPLSSPPHGDLGAQVCGLWSTKR